VPPVILDVGLFGAIHNQKYYCSRNQNLLVTARLCSTEYQQTPRIQQLEITYI
jgi:hypothetical protein